MSHPYLIVETEPPVLVEAFRGRFGLCYDSPLHLFVKYIGRSWEKVLVLDLDEEIKADTKPLDPILPLLLCLCVLQRRIRTPRSHTSL